jgi:hypothetical protein
MKLETDRDVELALSRLFHGAEEAQIGARIELILDSIESQVLPVNSRHAFELIVSLIERDQDAMECCGDHHHSVAAAVTRAIWLVAKVGRSLPESEVKSTLERLIAEDTYCTREALTEVVASFASADPGR